MIAELFYPKELKDIIADLRAKGDLNEVALSRLNLLVIKWLLAMGGAASIPLINGYIFVSIALVVILPIGIRFDVKRHISQKILPYLLGRKEILSLKKRVPYRFGVVLTMLGSSRKEYKTPLLTELWGQKELAKFGQEIECFVCSDSEICMPNIKEITDKYCLKKN